MNMEIHFSKRYASSVAGMVRSSRLSTDPEDPELYDFPKVTARAHELLS